MGWALYVQAILPLRAAGVSSLARSNSQGHSNSYHLNPVHDSVKALVSNTRATAVLGGIRLSPGGVGTLCDVLEHTAPLPTHMMPVSVSSTLGSSPPRANVTRQPMSLADMLQLHPACEKRAPPGGAGRGAGLLPPTPTWVSLLRKLRPFWLTARMHGETMALLLQLWM